MDDLEQLIIDGKYPSAEIKTEFMHDFMNCRGKVIQWKQHILRTVNQKNAKHYVLQNLDSTSVLIVLDWAMKFLPWYDRERQTDYYGKKGINWHISVVLMRSDNDQYFSECYAHLFNSFPQGWYTVASIIEHLFSEIKSRHPTITSAYLRSDNAGCYHCGPLVASIPGISERTGIRVCRIDFSEAQSGKDICDRTAPLKFHAKHYGNEGHNIANAVELKEALESYGGVQNTRVYVAEVDFSYQKLRKCSIPVINHLTNFMFQPDGLTAWQAYNVGVGRKMTNFELKQLSNGVQGETALKILEDAKLQMGSVRGRQSKVVKVKKPRMTIEESREDHEMEVDRCSGTVESAGRNEECSTYVCCECGASFSSLADFNMHHDIGDHNITSEDKVKLLWSHKCSSIKETLISMTSVGGSDTVSSKSEGKMGWALKKQRQCRRFSPAVKDFLFNLYTEGERTGQKYSPTDASKLIRCARDQNGVRTFHTDDWLSTQQIQGLFSRFTQKSLLLKTTEEVDIDLEEILKDIADREKQEKESAMIDRLCETVTDNV
ncbi:uncharacterized protein LOC134241721 [Saccostrea cucullata]|uniref:uncharacterized protein LOC134241721 n=1 Tax=Saccostrea cuccullata TaxID=36930 RepID=UPI002ED2E882